MKQWFCWLLALLLVLSLTGCDTAGNSSVREISSALSAAEEQIPESSASALESQPSSSRKARLRLPRKRQGAGVLIAYFSWAGNAVLEEDVDAMTSPSVSDPGNVQQAGGVDSRGDRRRAVLHPSHRPLPQRLGRPAWSGPTRSGARRPPRLGGASGGKPGAVRQGVLGLSQLVVRRAYGFG